MVSIVDVTIVAHTLASIADIVRHNDLSGQISPVKNRHQYHVVLAILLGSCAYETTVDPYAVQNT